MKGMVLAAAFMSLVILSVVAPSEEAIADQGNYCGKGPVVDLLELELVGGAVNGHGKVCATPQGLRSNMTVDGLAEGFAYTVWWVYIDDTSQCQGPITEPFIEPPGYAGPCGFADFFDFVNEAANPLVVFGRMDSAIPSGDGPTRFSGTVRGMKPSSGSQVWFLVFGHGPAATGDGQQLARQLLTPEDPASGAPHLGIVGGPQAYPSSVVVIDIP